MTQILETKKEIVNRLMEGGVLIGPEFLEKLNSADENELSSFIEKIRIKNLQELEKAANSFLHGESAVKEEKQAKSIKIIFSYEGGPKKLGMSDFIDYFNSRFVQIEKMLHNRAEMANATSIKRVKLKTEKEQVAVIGMVKNKQEMKNGNLAIMIEDQTDEISVYVNKNKPELFNFCKDIVLDEIIGVAGMASNKVIFASNIIFPDIPNQELKKSPIEEYAVLISDLHFGSKHFLKEEFSKFIRWIRGEFGTDEQREIAGKVSYLFIAGDLVDGVGIYPGQEDDLEIKDIYQQYKEFANFLKEIPSQIKIIVCPGNHDAMRVAEPQPLLYKDFAEHVWNIPNIIIVSNPSYVNFGATDNFPGFNLMFYHGYSFPYYAENIESIRLGGGQERPDLIMKSLLQKRHLAPTHTSSLTIPDIKKDSLVISMVPDFFVSGHIHRASVTNYKNVTMLNCSCWIPASDFQMKLGLNPQPARVPIINLQTRQAKILKF
jgi:DNA polymerase II small subunit